MKKRFLLATGALLCLGLAAPAQAAPTITNAGSANAFWETYEQVSHTTYRVTSWYVGVYSGSDATFSDVYKDVALCEIGHHEEGDCTLESSSYGSRELNADQFTIDGVLLDSAHLDAAYDMKANDAEGNPIGDPVATASSPTGPATVPRNAIAAPVSTRAVAPSSSAPSSARVAMRKRREPSADTTSAKRTARALVPT